MQQKTKIETLETILEQYEAALIKIVDKAKKDIPCIVNKTGDIMVKKINEIATAKPFDVQSSISSSEEDSNNADFDRRIKLIS